MKNKNMTSKKMQQFFNHTQGYGFNWPNAVNDYHFSKSNLEWGYNPKPYVVSHRLIKENERTKIKKIIYRHK